MKLSDYLVEFLYEKGVEHFFGYQGTMIMHVVESISQNPNVKNHSCYNEQGAAFAACGQAKESDKCAVAYATSGPAAVNLLSGVADAYFDSAPVIFITGQLNLNEYTDVRELRQQGFQEIDIVSMAKPITKYCTFVEDADKFPQILKKAYRIANEGRKGPVLIDIPMNLQRAEIQPDYTDNKEVPNEPDDKEINNISNSIISEIKKSKRPVLLLGNGIDKKLIDDGTIKDFVETLNIPVVTSLLGLDILPFDHPLNYGFIGAAYGHRYANLIINQKSDLIISMGCSLCRRQTGVNTKQFAENAKIIRVDIDKDELKRKVHDDEICYNTNAEHIIRAMNTIGYKKDSTKWLEVCGICKEKLTAYDKTLESRNVNEHINLISKYTKENTAVCCDVGQHMMWSAQSFNVKERQRLLFSGGHGAMGFSLPASIGAYYSTKKPSICIVGDGSLQMNIQELQWIVRERLPITIFIMNNHSLGLIRQQQDSMFNSNYVGATDDGGFSDPDFKKIGNAYGINSTTVKGLNELEDFLKSWDSAIPNLINILLPVKTMAYPKTKFGDPIHNQEPHMPEELLAELSAL